MREIYVEHSMWESHAWCSAVERGGDANAGEVVNASHSVLSDSLPPHGLYRPWNSPGQNTGVVSFPFFGGFSWPRDGTQVSLIAGGSWLFIAGPQGKPSAREQLQTEITISTINVMLPINPQAIPTSFVFCKTSPRFHKGWGLLLSSIMHMVNSIITLHGARCLLDISCSFHKQQDVNVKSLCGALKINLILYINSFSIKITCSRGLPTVWSDQLSFIFEGKVKMSSLLFLNTTPLYWDYTSLEGNNTWPCLHSFVSTGKPPASKGRMRSGKVHMSYLFSPAPISLYPSVETVTS